MTAVRLPYVLGTHPKHYERVVRFDPCSYCSRNPAPWPPTVDHVTPRSEGGRDNAGNITAACEDCNQSKGTRSLLLFLLNREGINFH